MKSESYLWAEKLMSFEEFAVAKKNTPYVFEIEHKKGKILYYGSKHSQNPKDKMFNDIKESFKKFKPDIILLEGSIFLNNKAGQDKAKKICEQKTEEQIIIEFGEMGLGLKLAFESDAEIESPEPESIDEVNHLLDLRFRKDDIFIFYMVRNLVQYQRIPEKAEKPDPEKLGIKNSDILGQNLKWEGYNFSFDNFKAVFRSKFKKDFDIRAKLLEDVVDPRPRPEKKTSQTEINEIARKVSDFRDVYIMKRIVGLSDQYKRIMIIYGSAHAIRQERALCDYFKAV